MATEQAGAGDLVTASDALPSGDGAQPSPFAPPSWARDTGRWSWIIIAVILVAVCAFVVMAAIKLIVLAALFAVLIGGTFLPVVDWLDRHHFKRWIAALPGGHLPHPPRRSASASSSCTAS